MVPRPLQKLGGDSPIVSTVATLLGIMSVIPMCPILTLIKAYLILVCTHIHLVLLSLYLSW